MANKKENLFDMFPPISTDEWMAKINVDLKGADFNKKLVWRTNEGFNVMPFLPAHETTTTGLFASIFRVRPQPKC